MKTKLILIILTVGLSSLAAQTEERQRSQRPDPTQIFKAADTDNDGLLNLEELTALRANMAQERGGNRGGPNAEEGAPPPAERQGRQGGRGPRVMSSVEDMMARMDTDKDGKLSQKEFASANQRQGRGRGPGRGQGGGDGQRARQPE